MGKSHLTQNLQLKAFFPRICHIRTSGTVYLTFPKWINNAPCKPHMSPWRYNLNPVHTGDPIQLVLHVHTRSCTIANESNDWNSPSEICNVAQRPCCDWALVPVSSRQMGAQSGYHLTLDKYPPPPRCLFFVLQRSPPTHFTIIYSILECQFSPNIVLNWSRKTPTWVWTLCFFPPVGGKPPPFLCVAMEKPWRVEFRNVGSSYFPQSRVDCHYTLNTHHNWASNDWIGLFKVLLNLITVTANKKFMHQLQNNSVFSPSGWMVVSQGVPHVRLGSGADWLSRGHRCQLLCALPGYSCPCFLIVFYFPQ